VALSLFPTAQFINLEADDTHTKMEPDTFVFNDSKSHAERRTLYEI
jgi:hypothetical protein